jgi:hypothetical protein
VSFTRACELVRGPFDRSRSRLGNGSMSFSSHRSKHYRHALFAGQLHLNERRSSRTSGFPRTEPLEVETSTDACNVESSVSRVNTDKRLYSRCFVRRHLQEAITKTGDAFATKKNRCVSCITSTNEDKERMENNATPDSILDPASQLSNHAVHPPNSTATEPYPHSYQESNSESLQALIKKTLPRRLRRLQLLSGSVSMAASVIVSVSNLLAIGLAIAVVTSIDLRSFFGR